jgi:hypothetical protein
VVDAFFRAARGGDFDGLVAVLDPDVVLREDFGELRPPDLHRGAEAAARQALLFNSLGLPGDLHPVLVNDSPGVVVTVDERPFALLGFVIGEDRIVEIDVIADSDRVGRVAGHIFGDHGAT